ncbi:charged multivesicular body protein 7-like isoform X1 [Bufo gargarizans]|uniref:charged multivesicular body protein 7-like isoform X1 n=1 Tax=Bufo gargarizans TaxID=30331 RepID=UPI001CF2E76D|nr:charged multivesicular body protein 7-like isoform X1 [Bufo gargarizans]
MAPAFPSDWDDDERMSFLFSAFKQSRDVDSADWDSKMAFWTPLIIMHAKAQGLLTISLCQLQKDFTRKGISPLGLGTVVQEMLRQGSLQRESDFVAGITSGWVSWGVRELVIKPLRWTISSVLGGQLNPDEPFVVPEVIKEQADVVLQKYQSSPLCTVPLLCEDDVHGLCKDLIPTKSEFQLVLLQLLRDKKVCLLQRDGERLVKFVQGGSNQVTPIRDTDLGIYDLQKSEKLLSERLQSACDESSRLTEEAKSFNKAGNKQQAVRCLRRRKVAENQISALQSKLDTVQSILERISMAETDRKVVSAYQAGVSALRSAMKDVSLEKAESLVDQIQEFCDLQDDVNQTLSSVGTSDLDVDTDELERELNEILQKEEEVEVEVGLPDVPTGPLIASPQHPPLSHHGDNRALDMSGMLSALPDVPSGPPHSFSTTSFSGAE